MTDNPTSAAAATTEAQPVAPAVSPSAPSDVPLSYDGAIARKAELFKTAGFADRWLNGELAARKANVLNRPVKD
jgi:hypothetical protein